MAREILYWTVGKFDYTIVTLQKTVSTDVQSQ